MHKNAESALTFEQVRNLRSFFASDLTCFAKHVPTLSQKQNLIENLTGFETEPFGFNQFGHSFYTGLVQHRKNRNYTGAFVESEHQNCVTYD